MHGWLHSYPITQLLAICQANINRGIWADNRWPWRRWSGDGFGSDWSWLGCLADKRQTKKWQFGCQEGLAVDFKITFKSSLRSTLNRTRMCVYKEFNYTTPCLAFPLHWACTAWLPRLLAHTPPTHPRGHVYWKVTWMTHTPQKLKHPHRLTTTADTQAHRGACRTSEGREFRILLQLFWLSNRYFLGSEGIINGACL